MVAPGDAQRDIGGGNVPLLRPPCPQSHLVPQGGVTTRPKRGFGGKNAQLAVCFLPRRAQEPQRDTKGARRGLGAELRGEKAAPTPQGAAALPQCPHAPRLSPGLFFSPSSGRGHPKKRRLSSSGSRGPVLQPPKKPPPSLRAHLNVPVGAARKPRAPCCPLAAHPRVLPRPQTAPNCSAASSGEAQGERLRGRSAGSNRCSASSSAPCRPGELCNN